MIEARATQNLSRFNLDFAGDSVGRVSSTAAPPVVLAERGAGHHPARTIRDHQRFTVTVPFTSSTTPEDPTTLITAWFATPSGSFTAFQPNYAHTKFPINDHPSDKSSYTLRFDVPAGTTAVGNGLPTDRRTPTAGRSRRSRSASRWRPSWSRSTPGR